MKPRRAGWLGVICSLILTGSGPVAFAQLSLEQELKAGILYNFLLFVDWPSQAFRGADAPIRMCVLEDESFAETLAAITRGKQVKGRSVEVSWVKAPADARSCHLLFAGGSVSRRLPEVLEATKGVSVLSVCDDEECVSRGGMIRVYKHRNKMDFEIGPAADTTGLKISSSLRSLARRVPPGDSSQ